MHGCAWTGPYRCSSCSPDDDDTVLTFPPLPGMPAEWPPDDAPWVWPTDDGSAPAQPGDLPHLRVHVDADDAVSKVEQAPARAAGAAASIEDP